MGYFSTNTANVSDVTTADKALANINGYCIAF